MDPFKRNQLIASLSQAPQPHLVPIAQFFDGNDDVGSIGCNLSEHPGIAAFREICTQLASRQDVSAIYAQIAELDPGDDCWPFSDTIFVVGSIDEEALRTALAPLEPDEISTAEDFGIDCPSDQRLKGRVLVAWWD